MDKTITEKFEFLNNKLLLFQLIKLAVMMPLLAKDTIFKF